MKKREAKVVVVTGASSGIGLSVAKAFADRGDRVYGISRRRCPDARVESLAADVTDSAAFEAAIRSIAEREGRIDAFVSNAGFGIAGAVDVAEASEIAQMFATDLTAAATGTAFALPYLKKARGSLLFVSSVAAVIPIPYQSCYSAAKAGLDVFARAVANEEREVRVTVLLLGDTKTGFPDARLIRSEDERDRNAVAKYERAERKGKSPDSAARAAVRLASRRRPPLRKTVGLSYKIVVFLSRILPTRLLNFLVRHLYG